MTEVQKLEEQKKRTEAEIKKRGGKAKAPNYAKRLAEIEKKIKAFNAPSTPSMPLVTGENLVRFFTLGAAGYSDIAYKEIPADGIPAVLLTSLNKKGKKEDFKGRPLDFVSRCYKGKFKNGVFVVGLWRDNHDFKRTDDETVVEQATKLQALFNGKPIYFMPFLEHTEDASFMKVTFEKIRKVAPSLILVNNPSNANGRAGEYVQGVLNEVHHNNKPRGKKPPLSEMIFCFDGVNAFDADFEKFYKDWKGVKIFSVWIADFNMKMNTSDETLRPNRKHKPNTKVFKALIWMLSNRKAVNGTYKNGKLYKSHADRHKPNNTDTRAGLPLSIIKEKGKDIVVKDKKGKKVFTMSYSGKYKDGRDLYRSIAAKWGYEYAQAAKKNAGTTACDVFLDGQKIGEIDPAYREGEWRVS